MIKVNLYTKNGELVITVMTPPFNPMPDCIAWGSRFFFKNPDFKKKDESGYYEGLIVAAINVVTRETSIKRETDKKEYGNDDLLFGLPNDLDEAVETFLEFYSKSEDFQLIDNCTEDKFLCVTHHASGQFIRNSWYLWWHEDHGSDSWPKSKPQLVQWFNNLGIYHADDMSSIIIRSAYRRHHKQAILIEKQVSHYRKFWKEQGFEDGIYKPR